MKPSFYFTLLALLLSISSQAQKPEFFSTDGKAIKGYDPVAFFTQSTPVKGYDSIQYNWKGANWFFASEANKKTFAATPEQYAPQYGGYCAYGTSNGYKAPTETNTWTIVNNKLYFNYNLKVKDAWNKNQDTLIRKADINWEKIKLQ